MDKSSRHQFRWRRLDQRWITSDRRISKPEQFTKQFRRRAPTDLYIGTAAWLDPVGLPRIRQTDRPAPILIDHLIVFDIDFRPFCYRRLERARRVAHELLEWLEQETELELVYVSYSGSKGFHILLRDPDRTLFAIEDPREREQAVRDSRKELLERVLTAGFPVDKTVTADTRRIIRLLDSLHGSTGWVCTRITPERLAQPLKRWIQEIPRHPRARRLPYWPLSARDIPHLVLSKLLSPLTRLSSTMSARSTSRRIEQQLSGDPETAMALQVSSHVIGTKDRSAILLWLPPNWKAGHRQRFSEMLEQYGWQPAHRWSSGERELVIVPRAIPREQLVKQLPRIGLQQIPAQIERLGHYWCDVSPRHFSRSGMEAELEYLGELELDINVSSSPLSKPHIELIRRLGIEIELAGEELSGRPEPSLRMVKRT